MDQYSAKVFYCWGKHQYVLHVTIFNYKLFMAGPINIDGFYHNIILSVSCSATNISTMNKVNKILTFYNCTECSWVTNYVETLLEMTVYKTKMLQIYERSFLLQTKWKIQGPKTPPKMAEPEQDYNMHN